MRVCAGIMVALPILAASCSGSGSGAGNAVSPGDNLKELVDQGWNDEVPGDSGDPGSGDAGHEDVGPVDVLDDAADSGPSCPGGLGCPCVLDQDCFSGVCAETAQGLVCSSPCESPGDCPAGWLCVPVGDDEAKKGCKNPFARLCRPCIETADCDAGVPGLQYSCVEHGPDGSFCAVSCEGSDGCPDGYSCETAGVDGPGDCTPEGGGKCPCLAEFVTAGYVTKCRRTNEWGTCEAERTCDVGCPAPTPAIETCNDADDDCNGETDEGLSGNPCPVTNEHGTCGGLTTCVAGKEGCEGTPAVPEECNGVDDDCDAETDEGFPNLDGDAEADCVDPDWDGDGVVNESDNCPEVINEDQADCNEDGTGDACDDDDDDDGVADDLDNCWCVQNGDQKDTDGDKKGDACDCDMDDDGVASTVPGCPKPQPEDNCPLTVNPGQGDNDGDGDGDACDPDDDDDGVVDGVDKCPFDFDPFQADLDKDGKGDACDDDTDGDGVLNDVDNCLLTPNPDQADLNENGKGDACEDDWDGDGYLNDVDVCPWVPNLVQSDMDGDGEGDACDCDADGDGLFNVNPGCPEPIPPDNCALVDNPGQADQDADGIGDLCDPDRDGDGDPNENDCAPDDPAVFHGQNESCSGVDDDCDGETDEEDALGCTAHYLDGDGDGYGTSDTRCLCKGEAPHTAKNGGDCDDGDPGVNPGETESCDGKDDDCDGETDEKDALGCVVYYKDIDSDGYGFALDSKCLCAGVAPYDADEYGDCDQDDPGIHPFADEYCNLRDDDCDGSTDEQGAVGCFVLYRDEDADGFGVTGDGRCLCNVDAPYTVLIHGDCNDSDPAVFPAAQESCDGKDEDCDGETDEAGASGCTAYYRDLDRDGYGPTFLSSCRCAPEAPWDATASGDCNDNDDTINPGAVETCDLVDDDCDGDTDEEAGSPPCGAYPTYQAYYLDSDHDGYWQADDARCLCGPSGLHTSVLPGDCDDAEFAVNPAATEKCANLRDDDCNGSTDEAGCSGCIDYYKDSDGDTFGVTGDVTCIDQPTGDYKATRGGDCDDLDAGVNPDSTEACNSKDDDCDGSTDEKDAQGCTDWWYDGDQDGWGANGGESRCLCAASPPWSAPQVGDCIDVNGAVNPGADESCNGTDDDCDGTTDTEGSQGCSTYMVDADGDGYGSNLDSKCLCGPEGAYLVKVGGDCDDDDGEVNPEGVESCDGRDEDCDGITDPEDTPGCDPWYFDFDGDFWGTDSVKCLCGATGYYRAVAPGDCNDLDSQSKPGGEEKCDGRDNDCDGSTDPPGVTGCVAWYADLDGDGYGSGIPQCLCGPDGAYDTEQTGDCNDQEASIFPGAEEACDGVDNDCDGGTDEGMPVGEACDGPDSDLCEHGTWTCKDDGTGVQCANESVTGIDEQCNGVDDDCNGITDDGDPTTICPIVGGGALTCVGGACVLECDGGYYDVNQDASDGCECPVIKEVESGQACALAKDLGDLSDALDGEKVSVSGQILPDGDEDWYRFTAVDSMDAGSLSILGADKFHVRVRFTAPAGGDFRINVYRGSCGEAVQCGDDGSDTADYHWFTDFLDQAQDKGEDGCVTEPGPRLWDCCTPGQCEEGATTEDACCMGDGNTTQCSDAQKDRRHCSDDGAEYYVRVFRPSGSPAVCSETNYTIQISNGIN